MLMKTFDGLSRLWILAVSLAFLRATMIFSFQFVHFGICDFT